MFSLYKKNVERQFEMMLDYGAKTDAILASGFNFAAPTVSEYYRIPMIHTVHAPVYFPSRFVPPANIRNQCLPWWLNSLSWKIFLTALDFVALPTIKRYRKKLGLHKIFSIENHLVKNMVLAMDFPLAVLGRDRKLMKNLQTAYPSLALYGSLDPLLQKFMDKGPQPLYFGFGSMLDNSKGKTLQCIKKIVKNNRLRVVVHARWLDLPHNNQIDENIFAAGFCPHGLLFPHMAAVIHHGGAGTVHSCARSGVPQLIIPHLLDQYYLANRIHSIGCGPKPLPRRKLTFEALDALIKQIVENPGYRKTAQKIAKEINKKDGTREVAELILSKLRVPGIK